jgi:hypothetical protein|eukprot:COSAG03_NODE_9605_length_706_cov_1.332784_1_plen_123_part_00
MPRRGGRCTAYEIVQSIEQHQRRILWHAITKQAVRECEPALCRFGCTRPLFAGVWPCVKHLLGLCVITCHKVAHRAQRRSDDVRRLVLQQPHLPSTRVALRSARPVQRSERAKTTRGNAQLG